MGRVWTGAILAAVVAVACSRADEAASPRGAGEPRLQEAAEGGGGVGGEVSATPLPAVEPSVIKTADLEVEVASDGFGQALDGATQVAAVYGGYVVSTTTAGEGARHGSVVLRVPSDRFEEALRDLRGLGEVRRDRVSGEDVSQEFVDLEARLRNLEAQEVVLLRLFDEAVTVTDTIRVQRELSGVQLQIEEIHGRLQYLRDRTSLATIRVAFAEEGAAAPGMFDEAVDRAVDGFVAVLAALVVALGYVLPLALLGLVGLVVVRRVRPRTAGARPAG
jgi:hypothetical protein